MEAAARMNEGKDGVIEIPEKPVSKQNSIELDQNQPPHTVDKPKGQTSEHTSIHSLSFINYKKKAKKVALPSLRRECKTFKQISFEVVKNLDEEEETKPEPQESVSNLSKSSEKSESIELKRSISSILAELADNVTLKQACPLYKEGYIKNLKTPYDYSLLHIRYNSYWMDCINRLSNKTSLSSINQLGYYRALNSEKKEDIKTSLTPQLHDSLPLKLQFVYKYLNQLKKDIVNEHDNFICQHNIN